MSIFSATLGFDAANDSAKAAKGQTGRNSQIAKGGVNLFNSALPMAQEVYGSLDHYGLGHALGAALNGLNQDPQQRIQQFGAGATESASNNANQQANLLRSQGYGDGVVGGVTSNLFQNAAGQTNAYASQQYDPEEYTRRIMALIQSLSGITGGVNNALAGPAQLAYGQPQVQQTQNPLAAILGQAAGAYSSGFAGAAGKKAGG